MTFRRLEYSDRYQRQYSDWLERADLLHHEFVAQENESIAWTPVDRDLATSRVAIVTTAGVHPKFERAFDDEALEGDASFRVIPGDINAEELMVTHNHYDHSDGDRDINCVFPIDRARELVRGGKIGELTDQHYGFMGFNPSPARIVSSGREVAGALAEANVNVVVLVPG